MRYSVRRGIFTSDRYRHLVCVARFDMRIGKEFGRSDCENAGAGPNVEKTATAEMFLDRLETETSCFVSSRAESHAGLDTNHDPVVRLRQIGPWRRDYKTTNFNRLPVLLPLFKPVVFGNLANAHVAHGRRRQIINTQRFKQFVTNSFALRHGFEVTGYVDQ